MLSTWILAAALTGSLPDVLATAIENFHRVNSYQVTIRSSSAAGEDNIHYYYRRPGFVRIEFIRPHAGTVLIYSPLTQRVRLWPFGVGHFPELSIRPINPLIQSSRGQRIDRSDAGALFENIRTLQSSGTTEILGEDSIERKNLHLVVTGSSGFTVADVHRYEFWLDTANQFPVKVISRDLNNAIIETVVMEALEINGVLPDALFDPK